MSAEKVTTYYPAVDRLASFWEAVWSFEELKRIEGKETATRFMTTCVLCNGARGVFPDGSHHPRSTPAQAHAFHALRDFLSDVEGYPEREAVAFESVWETAGV